MNRRIRSKSYGEAKIRDILRPEKTQAGTQDTEAEIRDVTGNTRRLASLVSCGEEYIPGNDHVGFN